MKNKLCSLQDAIAACVQDGDVLSLGGFTTNRKPYAAVHEILRQGQKDLIAVAGPAGGDWDLLIGAGRVKAYINCYTANSGVTNVSRRFRSAIEKGEILFEDYSQDVEMLMIHAAALGLPFLPVRLMMGSGLTDHWGISAEERAKTDKLSNLKLVEMENPFQPGEKTVCVPVPRIDTAIIHVQKASPDGTCRIEGDEFHDVDIAVAARRLIVTSEKIVSNEEIRRCPEQNSIPCFVPDCVVHAPYGAHPAQCYNYYDYDNRYLREYDAASKTQEAFDAFCEKYVYSVADHEEYLNLLGAGYLIDLNVTEGYGYKVDLAKEKRHE